ncbi:MAG: PH domain-containing protein [Clostridia bacterium]|nr:PH domain-containing protein [Clostridia bacterium]
MNNNKYLAHPITVFLLLKSWWFVFTAPFARVAIQRLLSKDVQKILLSESVLLLLAVVLSIIGWICTKIVILEDGLKFKRGILLKSNINIDFSHISSVSVNINPFYALIGCAKYKFNTKAKDNTHCEICLKIKDASSICDAVYKDTNSLSVKRERRLRRYLSVPFWIVLIILGVFWAQILFLGKTIFLKWYAALILCGLTTFYGLLCLYDYKTGKLYIGNVVFVKTARIFGFKKFCCNKTEVGIIKITQNPIDLRYNTCKIKFMTVGESKQSIKIKHIEHTFAAERIKNVFLVNNKYK